jgi:hypothetical protein
MRVPRVEIDYMNNAILHIECAGEFFSYDYANDMIMYEEDIIDYDSLTVMQEEFNMEFEQDWDAETSTATFECGSTLQFSGDDVIFVRA